VPVAYLAFCAAATERILLMISGANLFQLKAFVFVIGNLYKVVEDGNEEKCPSTFFYVLSFSPGDAVINYAYRKNNTK
jgi:hypothetical protein